MQSSEASGGDLSSATQTNMIGSIGPPCRCGKSTKLFKAWTNDNPGRRFFRCGTHGFCSWLDEEEPHGWQKTSLLEAREQIQRQRSEIQKLQSEIRVLKLQKTPVEGASGDNFGLNQPEAINSDEKQFFETEALKARERESLLRQILLISWGGFLAGTAIIISLSKK